MGGEYLSVSSASQEQVFPSEHLLFPTGLHVELVAFIHRFGGPPWACSPCGEMIWDCQTGFLENELKYKESCL